MGALPFIRRVLAGGVALLLAASSTLALSTAVPADATPSARAATAVKPNILFIVTDDQRPDGWEEAMPQTVALLKEQGTTYTNFFGNTPLCCPDRAEFLSGRYAHNNGLRTNGDAAGVRAFDQAATIPAYLQAAGYHTAMAGKYLHPWDPLGTNPKFWDKWALTGSAYQDAWFNVNGTVKQLKGYNTTVLRQQIDDDLQAFEADDDAPWFAYVSTKAPHSPYTPEPKYANLTFSHWAGNPSVAEADVSDKPPSVTWRQPGSLEQANDARTKQLRTLRSVDDMVAGLESDLVRLGERSRTLVVFTSDNGYLWGDHRIFNNKRFPYTPSVQLPLIMRWPNHLAAGATDNRLLAGIDFLPSFLDVAGATPALRHPLDGRSMFASGQRSSLLLEYFKSPDAPLTSWASIRTDTYQFIEWYKPDGTLKVREYYDLTHDPWQLVNLLKDGNKANDPNVPALSAQLKADRTCVGAACP